MTWTHPEKLSDGADIPVCAVCDLPWNGDMACVPCIEKMEDKMSHEHEYFTQPPRPTSMEARILVAIVVPVLMLVWTNTMFSMWLLYNVWRG